MHRIGCLILAAGGSTRLGQPKQLLQMRGAALVCHTVRAAQEAGCDPVCVVTGHAHQAVAGAVAALCPLIAHHEEWQRGMGSSIRRGLSTLPPLSAVILLACDQPAVDATIIRGLIDHHHHTGLPIVASRYAQTLGIPALFAAPCFPELNSLPDDRGAKSVIQINPARVAPFDFPAGAQDLDTPEDLRAWQGSEAQDSAPT